MRKQIKTSELLSFENKANSITVSPIRNNNTFMVEIFLNEKTKKGNCKKKTILTEKIKEDVYIPTINNSTVAHLGYNTYKFIKLANGFYINFYKF